MPSFPLFRRRDPWWEVDGPAARRTRRRQRIVAGLALAAALVAVCGAVVVWAIQLGLAGMLGTGGTFGIG